MEARIDDGSPPVLVLHGGVYSRVSDVVQTMSIPQAVLTASADGVAVTARHVLARVLARQFAREVDRLEWIPSGTMWAETWGDVVHVRAQGRRLGLVNRAGDRCKFSVSRRRTMDELVAMLTALGIAVEPRRPTYRFMSGRGGPESVRAVAPSLTRAGLADSPGQHPDDVAGGAPGRCTRRGG
ncbi:MAG: hypothetical protein HGA44_05910 [Cellulomonadaceae bacterium]|nr:hypothetical protein [Cellulomonadaceae bacterium]